MISIKDKCNWLVDEVGFDVVLNYKVSILLDCLVKDVFFDGIDVYFDNVGGDFLSVVVGNFKEFVWIVLCGFMLFYDIY